MENIAPTTKTSVDESKVHGLPELNIRDPQHKVAEPTASAHEVSTHAKKETNPIILVFKAMIVAKGILREGLKETKNSNRRHERQWEAIALEQQNEHKKTAASQKKWSYAYALIPVVQVSGVFSSQWLKAKNDTFCDHPTAYGVQIPWAKATTDSTRQFFTHRFPTFLHGKTEYATAALDRFLKDPKNHTKVGSFAETIGSLASKGVESQMGQLNFDNQANQAPLTMKVSSYSSLYQNRGSEESSDKQQLSEVDRSMRDLMQQESQVFQGSSGRG
ncbi:MAG: hypothetical protein H7A38_06380 [Chlamydiales bacterium]|nr:hypothetical protein [Chlamydiales bacterium]